jgi:hypothetical protein
MTFMTKPANLRKQAKQMAKDDTDDFAAAWQHDANMKLENQGIARVLAFLRQKGALRDSMLGDAGGYEWLVLYTQDGAIDVKASDLTAENLLATALDRHQKLVDAANKVTE